MTLYKIYFNDRKIILSDAQYGSSIQQIYEFKDKKHIQFVINEFSSGKISEDIFVLMPEFENMFEIFTSCFKQINAAGGVVFNKNSDFLAIRRFGKWDLPKGKAEKKETPEITAVREVSEECGLKKKYLKILRPLSPSFHTYFEKGLFCLKRTDWFKMEYLGITSPIPQLEEDITEARWIDSQGSRNFLNNSYSSLHDVIFEAFTD